MLIYALLLLLLHSDIIEYSLPKLLEKLQISYEEVRLKLYLVMSLKVQNIIICNTTSRK